MTLPVVRCYACLMLLTVGVAAPASAAPILTVFSGSGLVAPIGPCGFDCLAVLPGSTYVVNAEPGWQLDALFSFDFTPPPHGEGTWKLSHNLDSVFGTFTSTFVNPLDPTQGLALQYLATGGTGIYDGFVGTGSSVVFLLGDPLTATGPIPFIEAEGVLVAAPEPASLVLLAGGLLTSAAARARRKSRTNRRH